MPQRYAVYSGYSMSLDNFRQLMIALVPDYPEHELYQLIGCYDAWTLRLPKADRPFVPRLLLNSIPGTDHIGFVCEQTVKDVVFPVRCVRYASKKQLLRNEENRYLWEQNERDMAKRNEFLRVLASHGATLDKMEISGFVCIKAWAP